MTIHEIKQTGTRVFLIEQNSKIFMVDAGSKGREQKVIDKIIEIGHKPEDVSIIAITHAHSDHAGGLAKLAKMTNAKIICQKKEAEFLKTGKNASLKMKSKILTKIFAGKAQKQAYQPIEPDIVFENKLDLDRFDIDGYMIHTPGHTHGSASIILQDKIAIIGDIAMNLFGLRLTPITYNSKLLEKSLQALLGIDFDEYYITHGGKVEKSKLQSLLD